MHLRSLLFLPIVVAIACCFAACDDHEIGPGGACPARSFGGGGHCGAGYACDGHDDAHLTCRPYPAQPHPADPPHSSSPPTYDAGVTDADASEERDSAALFDAGTD